MSREIPNTSYENGKYYRPDGRSDGNEFSALITTFMERMAVHDHSGFDSQNIFLPPSQTDVFIISAPPVADTVGWKTVLELEHGSTKHSMPEFMYKLNSLPDEHKNWVRFFPEYDADPVNFQKITLRRVYRNHLDFKVLT